MCNYAKFDAEFAEILEGKRRRREALILAVSRASPDELQGPADRLREAMRKAPSEKSRQRLGPPALSKK